MIEKTRDRELWNNPEEEILSKMVWNGKITSKEDSMSRGLTRSSTLSITRLMGCPRN